MSELTPEDISLKYAKLATSHTDEPAKKLEGIHGEGLGTGLPNDGDYSDIELRVLKFLHHEKWDFDDEGHVWGGWRQASGFPKPTRTRQCVHPKCTAHQVEPSPIAPIG